MKNIMLLVLIAVFLFQIVQSTNSTFNGLISSDFSLSKYYEKFAKDLVSDRLIGTKFCESILLPTDHTLRNSLQATLFSARKDTDLDDKGRLDLCCRSLHKCDAYKNIELNDKDRSIVHCECVHSFRICLKKLNTSLSSDLLFIHSINTTKCYAKDHPIIKCIKLEEYAESAGQYLRFMNSTLNDTYFNRCTKYEFDESQPQKLQLFDLPFIVPGISTIAKPIFIDNKSLATKENIQTIDTEDIDSKQMNNTKDLFIAMKEVFMTAARIGCEKIVKLEDEQRSGRHLKDSIVLESLKFLRKALTIYCKNKKLMENDLETCPHVHMPRITMNNSSNFTIINNYRRNHQHHY